MPGDLKITSEQVESPRPVVVLSLKGWLDQLSEEQLFEAVRVSFDSGSRSFLLDLKSVEMLTSAGVRAIQRIYNLVTPEHGHGKPGPLRLCNAPPPVYHVLSMTGLLQMVPNYESRQAAIDSYAS